MLLDSEINVALGIYPTVYTISIVNEFSDFYAINRETGEFIENSDLNTQLYSYARSMLLIERLIDVGGLNESVSSLSEAVEALKKVSDWEDASDLLNNLAGGYLGYLLNPATVVSSAAKISAETSVNFANKVLYFAPILESLDIAERKISSVNDHYQDWLDAADDSGETIYDITSILRAVEDFQLLQTALLTGSEMISNSELLQGSFWWDFANFWKDLAYSVSQSIISLAGGTGEISSTVAAGLQALGFAKWAAGETEEALVAAQNLVKLANNLQSVDVLAFPPLAPDNQTQAKDYFEFNNLGNNEFITQGLAGATYFTSGGNDKFQGTDSSERIALGSGSDEANAAGGRDTLIGGGGDDQLNGGSGNDTIDGGSGSDVIFLDGNRTDYTPTFDSLGRLSRITNDNGEYDVISNIESIGFKDKAATSIAQYRQWWDDQNASSPTPTPQPTPDPEPQPDPDTGEVPESLLSVQAVNKTLTVGSSVRIVDVFPLDGWRDDDGVFDIVKVYLSDRTIGGGYLTRGTEIMSSGGYHEVGLAELGNWRFVASGTPDEDYLGFNIVQANGEYSPRLEPGAKITTVAANDPKPSTPDPEPDPSSQETTLDLDRVSPRSVSEDDTRVRFEIERNGNQDGDIVVEWRIRGDGDNPADERDFSATKGTVTLKDGQGDKTFSIYLNDDSFDEPDEGFEIDLDVVSGNARFTDDDASFTIIDDDDPLGIDPNVDDHGNSFGSATSILDDEWERGFIETFGDVDYFKVNLRAGYAYEAVVVADDDLSLIDGDPDADFTRLRHVDAELFNSSFQRLYALQSTSTYRSDTPVFEVTQDGAYYLKVREDGNNDVGQYFVKLDIRVDRDDYAANTSTTGVIEIDDVTYGRHERDNDDDWFKTSLIEGETYQFTAFDDSRALYEAPSWFGGFYYVGWYTPLLTVRDSNGTVVATAGGDGYESPVVQLEAPSSGDFYVSVDGAQDRAYHYALASKQITERPSGESLVVQGADVVTDVRYRDGNTDDFTPFDDETLTTNGRSASAIKFDLDGLPSFATYAAIEVYLSDSAHSSNKTNEIIVDALAGEWNESTLFTDLAPLQFDSVVLNSTVGEWVTIEITDLYNDWVSGAFANNGIALSSFEFGARLTFPSSDNAETPELGPRLVIYGPEAETKVVGNLKGALGEDVTCSPKVPSL